MNTTPARPKRTPRVTPKAQSTEAGLEALLLPIRDVLRRREFQIIGNLSFANIETPNGERLLMDFRKTGPAVAMANAAHQMMIVGAWTGIPPRIEVGDDFCAACLAKCEVCDGSGKKRCEAPYCGGSGTCHLQTTHINNECHDCPKCGNCEGTGQAKCSGCRGSGQRGTGHEKGSHDLSSPTCKECEGRGRAFIQKPVNPIEFSLGTVGRYMMLGPIVRFSVRSLPNSGRVGNLVYDVDLDPDGNPLVIFVAGTEAFMIGGLTRQASR